MLMDIITGIFLSKITILLIDSIAIYLAYLVYMDNPRGRLNILYLITTLLMMLWVNSAYIPRVLDEDTRWLGLMFLKIAWFATPLFFMMLYFLSVRLMRRGAEYRYLSFAVFTIGIISAILTGLTDYVVSGVKIVDNIVSIEYGVMMYPFLCIILIIIASTLYPVFRNRLKRKNVKYFLVGVSIFYLANAIFNIILPVFFDIVRFYFIGDYSLLIFLGYTAFSILRFKLFDIRVVMAEVLTFSIWLFLSVEIFTTDRWWETKRLALFVLFLLIFFGILLVRSVKNEVEQRYQLEKISKKLKSANNELRKLDKAKSEFISIASHQLRTPLTAIKGYTSMILEGDYGRVSSSVKEPIKRAFSSTERMVSLVENLLNISRIESGKIVFVFKDVDFEKITEGVVKEFGSLAKKKNLYLKYNSGKGIPKIKADYKIKEVISNLIDNAIKYTDKGGVTVDLKLKSGGKNKFIELSVSDTGIGINKDDLKNVFEKFRRGKKVSLVHTEGLGLGMYFSQKVLEAHNATISVSSRGEGRGTTFKVKIPV